MTVPTSQPTHDTSAMLRMLLDEGYCVTFAQHPADSGYLAELTGPLGSQATGAGDSPACALTSVWPLDISPDDEPEAIDATAATILAGKITALREYVGRAATDGNLDPSAALDRISGDLGRISVILAAATEDDEDDTEPYCATCGHWIGHFHGLDGWRHYKGDPAPGGQRELYESDHEAAPAWCVPRGRSLSPADMAVICDALADGYASTWHRDEPGDSRAAAYAALLGRLNAAGSEQ